MNENFYSDILKNDLEQLEPDPGIEKRLEYVMQMKARSIQSSANSFLLILKSIFSFQHFAIKSGIIAALVIFSFAIQKIPEDNTFHLNSNV